MAERSPCLTDAEVAGFFAGEANTAAQRRIDEHIDACDDCRAWLFALTPEGGHIGPDDPDAPKGAVVGGLVGRYVLMNELGAGGMGTVYVAYDPELDRDVALKLLRASGEDGAMRGRDRMLREARALARLAHSNIVHVYDVGVADDDEVFIAMELVEGLTLREWSAAHPRRADEVVEVLLQAGRGLAAAHEAGMVHRDVKPENILVGADGRVRIGDFGLARRAATLTHSPVTVALRTAELGTITDGATAIGTPAYMAPELLGGAVADARSDQYSFFVTLYEALTHRRPRPEEHIDRRSGWPKDTAHAVPAWLRGVIGQGLRFDPDHRHSSMDIALARLGAGPPSRRRVAYGALAVLSLAVVGAMAFGLERSEEGSCGVPVSLTEAWSTEAKRSWQRLSLRGVTPSPIPGAPARHMQIVERRIDEHLTGLRTAYAAHCQAPAPDPRERSCLDWRAAELRSVLDEIEAHPPSARHAPHALEHLSALEDCNSKNYLRGLSPPTAASNIARYDIAKVRARGHLSRFAEAILLGEAVLNKVRDPAEIARAKLALAFSLRRRDRARAESMLQTGAEDAERAGEWVLAARMWTMLADPPRGEISEPESSAPDGAVARAQAAIDHLGGEPGLQSELDFIRSRIARKLAKNQVETLRLHTKVLRSWDLRERPNYARLTRLLGTMGQEAMARAEFGEARRHINRALAHSSRHLGPLHLFTVRILRMAGRLSRSTGDIDGAVNHYQRLLPLFAAQNGDGDPDVVQAALFAADVLALSGRLEEASGVLDRVEKHVTSGSPAASRRPGLIQARAKIEELQGRPQAAVTLFTEALSKTPVASSVAQAEGAFLLAHALTAAGQPRKAIALVEKHLPVIGQKEDNEISRAQVLLTLGTARSATGANRKAIATLERALTADPPGTTNRMDQAQIRLLLARLLWARPADRSRARGLARQARDNAKTLPAIWNPLKEDIAAWLIAHDETAAAVRPRPQKVAKPRNRCAGRFAATTSSTALMLSRAVNEQATRFVPCLRHLIAEVPAAGQHISLSWRTRPDGTATEGVLVQPVALRDAPFGRCVAKVINTVLCFPPSQRGSTSTNIRVQVPRDR